MNNEYDCFPICLLMRKSNIARVNVKVDCSLCGLCLPTSLAGMEDMMYVLVSLQATAVPPISLLEPKCHFQNFKFQNSWFRIDKAGEKVTGSRVVFVVSSQISCQQFHLEEE